MEPFYIVQKRKKIVKDTIEKALNFEIEKIEKLYFEKQKQKEVQNGQKRTTS